MSKKRKTRKEKEKAKVRHLMPVSLPPTETITYTIAKPEKKVEVSKPSPLPETHRINTYLLHDMRKIAAASGIVLAFDILLYALISTGTLRLGFLGY